MSATAIVFVALLLAVPVSLKYCLALETRTMVARLKRQERELDILEVRLQGLGRQREVVRGALTQVREQHRWAATRRDLIAQELERVRRQSQQVAAFHEFAGEEALAATAEAHA
ncbi:MAG: hypothetical protein ABIL09_25235 [Gemmatimonadota bacterium]